MLSFIQYNWFVIIFFLNLWRDFFLRENNSGTKQILFSGKTGGKFKFGSVAKLGKILWLYFEV